MQVEKLHDELQALGGGGVQIARLKVLVHVAPGAGGCSIVRYQEGVVRLRDPKAPANAAGNSAERCFKCPLCIFSDEDAFGTKLNEDVCAVSSYTRNCGSLRLRIRRINQGMTFRACVRDCSVDSIRPCSVWAKRHWERPPACLGGSHGLHHA
jgi:hypothetical protein